MKEKNYYINGCLVVVNPTEEDKRDLARMLDADLITITRPTPRPPRTENKEERPD